MVLFLQHRFLPRTTHSFFNLQKWRVHFIFTQCGRCTLWQRDQSRPLYNASAPLALSRHVALFWRWGWWVFLRYFDVKIFSEIITWNFFFEIISNDYFQWTSSPRQISTHSSAQRTVRLGGGTRNRVIFSSIKRSKKVSSTSSISILARLTLSKIIINFFKYLINFDSNSSRSGSGQKSKKKKKNVD